MTKSQYNGMMKFHEIMKRNLTKVGRGEMIKDIDIQIERLKNMYPQYN